MKAIVEGTVSRINANGIGFSVKESWRNREGGESHRFVSCFMPDRVPVTVIVGDEVKVTGNLRTAVSKRNAQFVDHTIGNASVEQLSTGPARSWGPDDTGAQGAWDRVHNRPADIYTPPEDRVAPPADEYPPDDPYADGQAWSVAPIQP